jgi:hypothetical protein
MVRRGSTVRVRQRALQKRRTAGFWGKGDLPFLDRAVHMEPLMEPSDQKLARESDVFG